MTEIVKKTDIQEKTEESKLGAKKMVRLSLAVALLMPMAEVAHAQAVNCSRAITYGSFAETGGGGTITVTPATGKVSTKGAIALLGTPLEARCSAKSFATTSSVAIKLSAKATDVKGAGTMSVKQFNIGTAAGGATKTYTSASLTATPFLFGVGAELHVNNAQAIGAYSGKLVMTVTFTP